MTPCISQVTTLNAPFETDIAAFARAGWPAVELWLTKLETYLESHTVDDARNLIDSAGIQARGAAGQGGLLVSRGAEREAHWAHFRRRLEIVGELGVPVLVIAADFLAEPGTEDLRRATDSLAAASELAAPAGVRLAVEFQKTAKFCASLDTTLALIAQSGAGNLGVCLDLFHYYTGPSKFEDLAYLSRENLAWVQVSDLSGTPRELARDADRILPGEGDFQLAPILEHLARIGYDGCVSLELFNPQLWGITADQVAHVALQAMQRVLPLAARGTDPGGN